MTVETPTPTDTDVAADAAGADQQPVISARDQKLQEMRERIRLEREADNAGAAVDPPPAVDATVSDESPAAVTADTVISDEPPAVVPTVTADAGFEIFMKDGKQHVRLKAYGQTEEIPLENALRRAQKDVAAERKLQEAIERERRAAATQRLAEERLAALQAPVQQPADTTPDLKAALEEVYEGNLDSAAAKLQQLITQGRSPATPFNPEVIAQQVEQRLQHQAAAREEAQYQADLLSAVDVFEEEFPDLASDARLSGYFDKETELVMQKNPKMPLTDVVRTAAATIRKLVSPASSAAPNIQTRIEAKRNAPTPIAGVRSTTVSTRYEAPPQPKTPRDVIAEMRKRRGQVSS